jgi:thioesterase domain-containing protein/acyl carrier protein
VAVGPRTPLELHLKQVWERMLGQAVGMRDNFFDLGGHSLLAVRLISEINKSLDVNFPFPAFARNPTIEGTAEILQREEYVKGYPKLLRLKPPRPAGDLFFISPGLALCRVAQFLDLGPNVFATWVPLSPSVLHAANLSKAVDLPGLEEMAAPHVTLIMSQPPSGPCFLAGHSFNGLLAFEVAHQLQRKGRQVELVLLLDTHAHRPPWWKNLQELALARGLDFVRRRASRFKSDTLTQEAELLTSSPESVCDPASKEGGPLRGVSWEIERRIYLNAHKKYTFRPFCGRGVLFRAQHNAVNPSRGLDETLGWARLFPQGLEIVDLQGDHLSIVTESNARSMAGKLIGALPGGPGIIA